MRKLQESMRKQETQSDLRVTHFADIIAMSNTSAHVEETQSRNFNCFRRINTLKTQIHLNFIPYRTEKNDQPITAARGITGINCV